MCVKIAPNAAQTGETRPWEPLDAQKTPQSSDTWTLQTISRFGPQKRQDQLWLHGGCLQFHRGKAGAKGNEDLQPRATTNRILLLHLRSMKVVQKPQLLSGCSPVNATLHDYTVGGTLPFPAFIDSVFSIPICGHACNPLLANPRKPKEDISKEGIWTLEPEGVRNVLVPMSFSRPNKSPSGPGAMTLSGNLVSLASRVVSPTVWMSPGSWTETPLPMTLCQASASLQKQKKRWVPDSFSALA